MLTATKTARENIYFTPEFKEVFDRIEPLLGPYHRRSARELTYPSKPYESLDTEKEGHEKCCWLISCGLTDAFLRALQTGDKLEKIKLLEHFVHIASSDHPSHISLPDMH